MSIFWEVEHGNIEEALLNTLKVWTLMFWTNKLECLSPAGFFKQ
jgi:hypothetical protein